MTILLYCNKIRKKLGVIVIITKIGNTVHLQGKSTSYIMFIDEHRNLLHFYYGNKIATDDYSLMRNQWDKRFGFASNFFSLDAQAREYPDYGRTDLRIPAYEINNKYGNTTGELKVQDLIIHKNEPADIKDMPGLFKGNCHADTLEVILCDDAVDFEVRLFYTVFDEYDIVARNAVLKNKSDRAISLESAFSLCLDLPIDSYDMIYFPGSWGREREMQRIPLKMGLKAEVSSARGGSSSQMNPFVMIATDNADENNGSVYGFSLIYSGNHATIAMTDHNMGLRILQGINPNEFRWTLKPSESFCTPQSVVCYSNKGFGKMSREFHDVFRNNIMKNSWCEKDRPILVNNWEGTYFDFDEEKLLKMARRAKDAGIEMFVLDDGWFGNRDDDKRSLGDWVVNTKKLPSGLKGLAEKINDIGLDFGLWIEPEMVNPDSDLYRAHPDWTVHVDERVPVESRHQLILDLSREEVCDYIVKAICDVIAGANIKYVKWDMNRQMTDMPRPGYNHEYTLGYYRIMKAITEAFPDVLFEGCSSGGARFDPGVLAYMPQIWTSDNSDAIARLKIQYSTSMFSPAYSIVAHVTKSPNEQCGRITSLKTRGDTALMGSFGYELDTTKLSENEMDEIRSLTERAKKLRSLIRKGDFYRLVSPFETNYCSWQVVSKDKKKVFFYACRVLVNANLPDPNVKLMGLNPDKHYRNIETGEIFGGDMLMYVGLKIEYPRYDFSTVTYEFEEL